MYLFFYKTNKKTALNRRFFVILSILQGVIPRHSERNKVKSKNLPNQCAYPNGTPRRARGDTVTQWDSSRSFGMTTGTTYTATTHHCHPKGFLTYVRNDKFNCGTLCYPSVRHYTGHSEGSQNDTFTRHSERSVCAVEESQRTMRLP